MILGMIDVFKGAGLLIYPLGACSAIAVFIIFERIYALRRGAVMPQDLVDAVMMGKPLVGGRHTVLARIVEFRRAAPQRLGSAKGVRQARGQPDGEGRALP